MVGSTDFRNLVVWWTVPTPGGPSCLINVSFSELFNTIIEFDLSNGLPPRRDARRDEGSPAPVGAVESKPGQRARAR